MVDESVPNVAAKEGMAVMGPIVPVSRLVGGVSFVHFDGVGGRRGGVTH